MGEKAYIPFLASEKGGEDKPEKGLPLAATEGKNKRGGRGKGLPSKTQREGDPAVALKAFKGEKKRSKSLCLLAGKKDKFAITISLISKKRRRKERRGFKFSEEKGEGERTAI